MMGAFRRALGLLAAGVILVGSVPLATIAQDASPSAAAPVPATQPTLTDAVDAAIAATGAEIAGDSAAHITGVPVAVREYVATHITPETYDGVLKGARGAFLTGVANSADQALLMAALLKAGGSDAPVRFATCELPAVGAAGAGPLPSPGPRDSALDHADEFAAQVTDPDLKAAILALRDFRARSISRTASAAQELTTALSSGAHPWVAATPTTPTPTDHVWLQVSHDGAWSDQDPTSATGAPPCSASATYDQLPGSLDHRVRLTLTTERQVAGALGTSVALDQEFTTADLSAARIAFGFAEPIGLIARPADDGTGELAYTPMLRIDGRSITGTPLMLPRIVASAGGDDGVGGFNGVGGFDGGLGGASPSPSFTETDPVTAAWLDIELTSPDGHVDTMRSDVFDRIGIVARADGGASTAPIQPLDQVDGEYTALGTMWQIGLLLGEVRQPVGGVGADLDVTTVDGMSGTIDALLRTFPALRTDLGGASGIPVVLLAGLSEVTGPAKRGGLQPGAVAMELVLDALHVPAPPPTDGAAAARDAEAVVGAEGMLVAITGGSVDPLGDAASVFQAATTASTPVLSLAPGDPVQVTGASPAALARLAANLDAGYSLLTPATAPSAYGTAKTAWWVIDPATGVVRDEHETGRHADLAEYGGTTSRVSTRYQRFCAFATRMRLPIAVAAFVLAAATGFDPKTGGALLKVAIKVGSGAYERKKKADDALKLACPGEAPPGPPLP